MVGVSAFEAQNNVKKKWGITVHLMRCCRGVVEEVSFYKPCKDCIFYIKSTVAGCSPVGQIVASLTICSQYLQDRIINGASSMITLYQIVLLTSTWDKARTSSFIGESVM